MSNEGIGLVEAAIPIPEYAAKASNDTQSVRSQTYDPASKPDKWMAKNLRAFISSVMPIADAVAIFLAAYISYIVRFESLIISRIYALELIVSILISLAYFERLGVYRAPLLSKLTENLNRLCFAFSTAAGTLIILDYVFKISDQISRIWSLVWFLISLVLLATLRGVVWIAVDRLDRAGRLATPIAIVGSRESVRRLQAHLSPNHGRTVNVVNVFDAEEHASSMVDRLALVSRTNHITEVLIPLPWTNATPLETLLRQLRNLPMTVKLVPEIPTISFSYLSFGERSGLPVISIIEQPLSGIQVAVKRTEDILISAIGLLFAAPLMLAVALLIRLDSPGPALFRQQRWGFNAKRISVLKFRTMRADTGDDPGVPQATRNDARVTRIGKFLRRTSLDELPQLINVLRGDMSLVGPRPHAVPHNEHYVTLIDDYLGRHRVKPGITGLAQINGCRGITDTIEKMRERVNYDLRYIDRWSLALDIKIIFATLFVGFVNKNAF